MSFDQDSVQQVNQMLEQLSAEMVINKTTYKVNRYLDLNIISPQISDTFNELLVFKIKILLEIDRQSFSVFLDKQSEINIVILPSMASYVDYIESLSLDSDRSQGKFWSRSNYAFVAFKNEQQATEVALHEAIHSIHFSLVGYTSRWLNEGLAQLFSGIEIVQTNGQNIFSLPSSYNRGDSVPMGIQKLVESEEQWYSTQRHELYSSAFAFAFAFVDYFFEKRKTNDILGSLLREEGKNPCYPLHYDHYLKVIDENLYNFRSDFNDWLEVEVRKN